MISAGEIAEIEPHATGLGAIVSPTTSIVDFSEVARALATEVTNLGATILTGTVVRTVRREARR